MMSTNTGKTPKALMSGGKCKPTRGSKKCVHTTGKAHFTKGGKSGKSGGKSSGHGK